MRWEKNRAPRKVLRWLSFWRANLMFAGSACALWGVPCTGERTLYACAQTQEPPHRTITFAERAAYQYGIEQVYWRHRIWPRYGEQNPESKPPLDATVSKSQIEHKVNEYLHKSQLVADRRGSPITASELQTEMERMASHTKEPRVLSELFQALGSDPFVVAECLVRPILAERLITNPYGYDGVKVLAGSSTPTSEIYKLPEIASVECADNWSPTTLTNAPTARAFHTAVWTGSEMIVWSGYDGNMDLNTGAKYNPATDSWTATNIANAPDGRIFFSAVWTGSEMIVWGGGNFGGLLNSGGRYNPIADTWTATSLVNVPAARNYHTAVWTGSEMIVWGGRGCGSNCILDTGGRYDPNTDTWTQATSTANAPIARESHSALWTGNQMIIWGGTDDTHYLHTGGRYNPNTDSWTPTGLTNAPLGRISHSALWTGSEMIVWGGVDETFDVTNTGGRYDPSADSWILTTLINAPSARSGHVGVWTGGEMIVWGGADTNGFFNTGGRYNPDADSWVSTTIVNAPAARDAQPAVWTGSQMIVWGGFVNGFYLNTGGRYCGQSAPTATPTVTPTATLTATPTLTPSATPTTTPSTTPRPTTTATASASPAQALNLSTRLHVLTDANVGIGGLIVTGTQPKTVVLRGIGPSLSGVGVPNPLADPVLELHGPTGFTTITNDNWMDVPNHQQIQALGLAPPNNLESAILATLPSGNYTAILKGKDNGVGVGLVEAYDVDQAVNSKLVNISTRGFVSTGGDIMIAGFILGGSSGSDNVIVRGLGPSLVQFGIPDVLPNPQLELRDSAGTLIRSNDDWMDDPIQATLISDAGLAPSNNLESAIYATLAPGQYTALLSGVNSGTGVGLVEAYDLQTPTNVQLATGRVRPIGGLSNIQLRMKMQP